MKYKLTQLVDISKLQNLMEGLYSATNISSGIIDIDGNILIAVGCREICLNFHRVNSETRFLCKQCDQYIKEHIDNSEPYICYTCANGLTDAAAPIIIEGEHVATLLHGQFLLEAPNIEQFRWQARKYAFNEDEYIKALTKVPIYSKAKLDSIIHFFLQIAGMLAEMGVAKKRFEKEMYRLEQLNLVGEMAAGLGHEVRNPLTTVRGFLQILGSRNYNQQDKEYFILMIQELDRANSIITEFLSLAKNKAIALEMKNLNSVISILTPLIEANVLLSDQELKLDLGEIPELLLDEQEIRQLILNLTQNGIDAMSRGGCLTIRTYTKRDEVIMEIQDEGAGIGPELFDKLGTPFFSTKDNGTGLGLAVCHSITGRHNAQIAVASDRGGTTFTISFKI